MPKNLPTEMQKRLEELRAKYPKYGPGEPEFVPERTTFRKSFAVYLRFEPIATSQEEANKMVYDWMWKHGFELSDLLNNTYRSQGLRGVTLVWE